MLRLRSAAVALLALAAYLPSLRVGFLTDDFDLVAGFSHLTLPQLLAYFGRFYSGEYRPLYFLSFAVDHALWGTWSWGYHLTNVAAHALNSLLVVQLARGLRVPEPGGWIAGSLFAVHGAGIGAVGWVSGRVDVLAAGFVLIGAVAFLEHLEEGGDRWLAVAIAAQILGLLCKETAAVLAPWAVLLAVGSPKRRGLLAAAPLLLVLLAHVLFWALWLGPEISYTDPLDVTAGRAWAGVVRLASVFGFPLTSAVWWSGRADAVAALCVLALAVVGLGSIRSDAKLVARLLALLAVSLVPVLSLLDFPRDLYQSRHAYLPGVVLSIVAALGIRSVGLRLGRQAWAVGPVVLFQAVLLQIDIHHWTRQGALARSITDAVASAARREKAAAIAVTGYPDMERGYFLFHGNSIGQAVHVAHPDLASLPVQCLGAYGCPPETARHAGSPLVRVRVRAFRLEGWSVER